MHCLAQRTALKHLNKDGCEAYRNGTSSPLHTLITCIPLPDVTSAIDEVVCSAVCAGRLSDLACRSYVGANVWLVSRKLLEAQFLWLLSAPAVLLQRAYIIS